MMKKCLFISILLFLSIYLIYFNSLRCALITVGHHDALRHSKSDIKTDITKTRVKDGMYVGEYKENQVFYS